MRDTKLPISRDELLVYADRIEEAAEKELRPMAVDPAAVLAGRGYTNLPQTQLDQHGRENAEAWQGAMQYAAQLRVKAGQMGEGELAGGDVRNEVDLVARATLMGGWLTNAQAMAWDHAQDRTTQIWDDGRELAELRNGEHHLQQEANTAAATGVMVHQDFDPGMTVERIRLVPSPDLPPVEDPRGEIDLAPEPPTPTPDQPEAPKPSVAEEYFRTRADELRFDAEEAAARADVADDPDEAKDLYQEAAELEDAAEACEEQADWERDNPMAMPEPPQGQAGTDPTTAEDKTIQEANAQEDAGAAEARTPEQTAETEAGLAAADKTVWVNANQATPEDFGWKPVPAAEQAEATSETETVVQVEEPEIPNPLHDDGTVMTDQETTEMVETAKSEEIDWSVVEESAGRPIPQEERNALEVDGLKAESDALVNAAEHVEGGHEWVKSEIEEAAADGEGVQERWDRQQADMDRWEAAEARSTEEEAVTSYDDEPWTVQAEQAQADSAFRELQEANAAVEEPQETGTGQITHQDGIGWGAENYPVPGYDGGGREYGYSGEPNPFGASYADTGFPGTTQVAAPVVASSSVAAAEETAGI